MVFRAAAYYICFMSLEHTHDHGLWTHDHRFLGQGHETSEQRARLAAGVTAVFMAVEIAAGFVFGVRLAGQKDDRDHGQSLRLANLPAKLQPILTGHHDIEDEKGGTLALGLAQDQVPGWIQFHREPRGFQMVAHQARNIGIVFHNEDVWFHASIVSGESPRERV